jgi:hypothetical protein
LWQFFNNYQNEPCDSKALTDRPNQRSDGHPLLGRASLIGQGPKGGEQAFDCDGQLDERVHVDGHIVDPLDGCNGGGGEEAGGSQHLRDQHESGWDRAVY